MVSNSEYSVDEEIISFFNQTAATREECDDHARLLTDSNTVVPVGIQGVCSYSVYAGRDLEYVVQFRLQSLALDLDICSLATQVYGSLAPEVAFKGTLGGMGNDETEATGKEPLLIYLMSRIAGITQLDFILSSDIPQESHEFSILRRNFMGDIAHFFALSWLSPQPVSSEYRARLAGNYCTDLMRLQSSLPARFQSIMKTCLASMDEIMALPMVLLHKDFGACNLLVDKESCHLIGVVDWAEASICPFGMNLHSIQAYTGKVHLKDGWSRFTDYDEMQGLFRRNFAEDAGVLGDDIISAIKLARVLGLLLSRGFTSRLANEPEPEPIQDDEKGRYNMMYLDAFLINEGTKFDGLA